MSYRSVRRLLAAAIVAIGFVGSASAEEGGFAWDKAPNRVNDMVALQTGAKLFVNYCLNCHSAAYMRFNRLHDIGLTDQQIKDNLLVGTDKVGATMKAAITEKQGKEWFGASPPDLTLVARSRAGHSGTGADYLYTYLRSYYVDDSSPTGWNNLAFPHVAMPHVLWQLQGERKPVFEEVEEHGQKAEVFKGWQQIKPGQLSTAQYDQQIGDLVAYLQWMAEPAQNLRVRLGIIVLLFLGVLTFFAWRLNAAYWKNVT